MVKEGCVTPAGAQLQWSPACSHFTGDQERTPQAPPPRTCRERLQTWILRGRPAGAKNTQVRVLQPVHQSTPFFPSAAVADQETRRRLAFVRRLTQIMMRSLFPGASPWV